MSTQEQNTPLDARIKYAARERFGKEDEYIEQRGAFYAGAQWALGKSESVVQEVLEDFARYYEAESLCNTETVVVQYIEIIAALYHQHMIHPVDCLNGVRKVIEIHKERVIDPHSDPEFY